MILQDFWPHPSTIYVQQHPQVYSPMKNPPFFALCHPLLPQKRAQGNNENPDDCRLKLMMKNRESAAQSRARKQCHRLTKKELEREVAHLKEENAKLKKHQKKVMAAINQLPKKNRLRRSLTTPF
ncbi:hypothetical protein J1N35_029982 [Gossypium stocksii]|uniref:BZIP domain-containing protein n=1 Tax=Gossypium stocksii TaxID=47602 RepID=A0A9D3UYM9_9ROSI|nr:hypothetical protein J1N35_029982 [Gossypium stocksii]